MMRVSKLKSLQEIIRVTSKEKKKGKKVVFTNGCFDLLHVGHVRYLRKARALGDILVVGVNGDLSVRSLKCSGRPVTPEKERAEVLSALESVDYVLFFKDKTPERLIRALRPDFLVKGGDWKKKDIIGGDFVESYGGKVRSLPFAKGFSTTRIIQKIKSIA